MWQPSVTTRKEYKNSYRARVGLFITEFVISEIVMCSRANTYGFRLCFTPPERAAGKTVSVRRLMGEGRETLRDDPSND